MSYKNDNSKMSGRDSGTDHGDLIRLQPSSGVRPVVAHLSTMLLVAMASITLVALFSSIALGLKPAPVKTTEDLPPGPMQAKATTSCLECHEARIILQQRLSRAVWIKEVDKMVRWGAVVDANDHDALIDYLSTNFSPDKGPYEPPRTSIEKASGK
jgi:hypothetical protein